MKRTFSSYHFQAIEKKWQQYWEKENTFQTQEDDDKEKIYILDMFPYPSGAGLHVGHVEGYTGSDIVARYKRMQGYNVLHPMGWDAFGLPAEQHALDTGDHPREITKQNIENYRRQLKSLGFSYDWEREISTTDPEYYKWTQWIFLKLYEKGLAYMDEVPVNWCPALGTVLANEEVIDGKSERGGHPVIQKPMRQWMLKITAYADRLLEDLEDLDWDEGIKEMQRNWIGRSEGADIRFRVAGHDAEFVAFTTRPDTLFGSTYCVLAPEHPLVEQITTEQYREAVLAYKEKAAHKNELERTDLAKKKTGVFTGGYAIHPVTQEKMPIWIADYVLFSYGTGAIMAVPAHDERDHEFAKTYDLPLIEVVEGSPNIEQEPYIGDGKHIHSDFLNGMHNEQAIQKMIAWLEENDVGTRKVTYRLRDWLFSRQRYWGEPIPILHLEDGTMKPVDESELPLELPEVEHIEPSGTGESPLANVDEWVEVRDRETGLSARRETNTMPQWAGSSWYYLRFIDPHNPTALCDYDKQRQWLPVDIYIGGAEHAVLHLLYARFWHKVLYDLGLVSTKEPFQRLVNQGMILGENNEKMSKSKGNVVNPDDVIQTHGADTLRVYEMFMGPLEASKPWSTSGVDGASRFLHRVWRLVVDEEGKLQTYIQDAGEADDEFVRLWHQTIKKVTEDMEHLRFNTAISQLMIFVNEAHKQAVIPKAAIIDFVKMLSPIAPHIAEELWHVLGFEETISYEAWPQYEEAKLLEDQVEIVVQVNGKIKARLKVGVQATKEDVEDLALSHGDVQAATDGKTVQKVIVVPRKLVNIVAN